MRCEYKRDKGWEQFIEMDAPNNCGLFVYNLVYHRMYEEEKTAVLTI